ncbi:MAG: hypothetical protein LIO65_02565, partial [Odoribacter sp.]|nr:hypothetical protein [Odoribacter sp.]
MPQLSLYYLMRAHVREQQYIMLPEVVERGVKGVFGEEWDINRNSNIVNREFCTNGILYDINKVLVPAHYQLVTKPLLTTPNYAITANMYFKAGQFLILTDPTPDRYTLFFQADSMLQNLGFEVDYGNDYFGDSDEKILLNNQPFLTYNDSDTLQVFTDMHILTEACIREFSQRAFYPTKEAFFYLYTGNGDIYDSSGRSYKILNSFETENGVSYEIDGIFEKPSTSALDVLRLGSNYSEFFTLLVKAGIIDAVNSTFTNISQGERFMLFAPKNGTFDYNALDQLPEDELASLLNYLFISTDVNNLTEYVLPNLGPTGTYQTLAKDEENSTSITTRYFEITLSFVDNEKICLTNDA